jgi:hypothetical protein
MKASEYQVSIPPHLKDFKWDGRGQTSLDWQRFKFKHVAKIAELSNSSRRIRAFINDAEQSMMQFEAFETFSYLLRFDEKTSCWKCQSTTMKKSITFATTCQNISGGFEDTVSSQLLVNPELGHSSTTNHYQLDHQWSLRQICSQIWDRWKDEPEIHRIPLFWSSQNQISYASWCTFHWRRVKESPRKALRMIVT